MDFTRSRARLGRAAAVLALALVALLPRAGRAASPPFLVDDGLVDEPGQTELDLIGQSTWSAGGAAGTAPSAELDHGVVKGLQLHAFMPLAFNRPAGQAAQWGPGDFEIGAKFRIDGNLDNDRALAIALEPTVDFPTGNAERGLGTGRTHAFLPIWFSKSLEGDWEPFGGGGYWINPGPGNKNWAFFGAGITKTLDAYGLVLGGEIFHATASEAGGKDSTGFDVGGTYKLAEDRYLLFTMGRGLQNADTTNRASVLIGFQAFF